MKFFLFSLTILVWLGMGVWLYGQAASTATVSATVTVSSLSVAVDDGSVAYGTLSAGATQDTFALPDRQVVTNDGNVTANINIRGATTDAWDMEGSAGTEIFRHQFTSADADTSWIALTDSYTLFADSVAANATRPLDLEIQVPTVTTATAEQQPDVTLQAASP